jgi:hypothetical protein
MSHRVSLYPGHSSSNAASVTKQRHMAALVGKMNEAMQNANALAETLKVTAEQAASIRELGAYHAAL